MGEFDATLVVSLPTLSNSHLNYGITGLKKKCEVLESQLSDLDLELGTLSVLAGTKQERAESSLHTLDADMFEYYTDALCAREVLLAQHSHFRATLVQKGALTLPNEIWDQVAMSLDVCDIQSVRLVSKYFAGIGARKLFQNFRFRVDRCDFERFHVIAESPLFISGLKTLQFNLGKLNIYQVATSLAYEYSAILDLCLNEPVVFNVDGFDSPNEFLDEAIEEYVAWNQNWVQCDQNFDEKSIRAVFELIPNLETIEIKGTYECPFQNTLLRSAWMAEAGQNTSFSFVVREFTDILEALKRSSRKHRIRRLHHCSLPVIFFARDDLSRLWSPLSCLTTLELRFLATQAPVCKFWKGLSTVLKSCKVLEELYLGFVRGPEGSFWASSEERSNWYLPLHKFLGAHSWSKLRVLGLHNLALCEEGLIDLFTRHSKSLRELSMANIDFHRGSFAKVMEFVNNHLCLSKCHISGLMYCWETSVGQRLNFGQLYDLTHLLIPNKLPNFTLGKMVEDYAVRKRKSLIVSSGEDLLSVQSLNPLYQDQLLDIEDIQASWDDEKNQDNIEQWERTFHDYTPIIEHPGSERFLLYCIDHEGYDEFGFDLAGFNPDGTHYIDDQPIHRNIVLHTRTIVDSIVEQLSCPQRGLCLHSQSNSDV